MESIVAAYGSASDSDNASSSDSEVEGSDTHEWTAGDDTQVGAKRKRSDEPQWKRAFPHVDGNWPSHVRIDIVVTPELRELARQIIEGAQKLVDDSMALVPFEELGLGDSTSSEGNTLHLSLSRPFVLTYDQIDGFVDSLRAALKWRQCFSITLRRPLALLNDDKARSFLALRVSEGEQQFVQVLRCVDQCLTQFKLPTYYKDPIPHVSIASSMGEELAQLTLDQCESLLTPEQEKQQIARPCFTACVAAVHVAIGNKHYDISLR